jgi:hypothetical protein
MGILNFGAAQGYMLGYGSEPIMLIFFAMATSAASYLKKLSDIPESLEYDASGRT